MRREPDAEVGLDPALVGGHEDAVAVGSHVDEGPAGLSARPAHPGCAHSEFSERRHDMVAVDVVTQYSDEVRGTVCEQVPVDRHVEGVAARIGGGPFGEHVHDAVADPDEAGM